MKKASAAEARKRRAAKKAAKRVRSKVTGMKSKRKAGTRKEEEGRSECEEGDANE